MTSAQKQSWEPMKIAPVGRISEVIEEGGGKIPATGGDPGESRKEQPSG